MIREQVEAWRGAAVADGWSIEPTYGDSESVETAAKLKRDGWVASIYARPQQKEPTINVWGPDRLAVDPPNEYDWAVLQSLLRKCSHCEATDVATQRVGFAGRVCAACLPGQRALIEVRNWAE